MVRKNEINPVWVFEEGIPTDLNGGPYTCTELVKPGRGNW